MQEPTLIVNAAVMTPDRMVDPGAVLIDGGRIRAVGVAAAQTAGAARRVDARGAILAPGFIDLQFNGAFGHDFTRHPETIWVVAAQLAQYGVTAFLPTLISAPLAATARAQAVLAAGPPPGFQGATPLGLHVEGPFLNPEKRGAHNPAHMRAPDLDVIAGWSPASGVRLVTLAPELPGALEAIRILRANGVVVSAGHSTATRAQADAAFAAGVTYGTHLYNAMPGLGHRDATLATALLLNERVTAGLIADGIHVHPDMVALAWRLKGPAGINLVTDAMTALGMPPGRSVIGDIETIVDATSARTADGRLAGSILSMDQAVRNLVAYTGCDLFDALRTVTEVPARVLGLTDRGRIAAGYLAEFCWLSPRGDVIAGPAGLA